MAKLTVAITSFIYLILSSPLIILTFDSECSGLDKDHGEIEYFAFVKLEENNCLNLKETQNGIQTKCSLSKSDRLRTKEYYKHMVAAESKRFNVKVALMNGKIKTVDIFDEIEFENPLQQALNNRGCKVVDHTDFLNTTGLKKGGLSDADLNLQIERLSSALPLERGLAAVILGTMGPQAVSAAPNLIKLLGDKTNLLELAGPLDGIWPAYYSKIREEKIWPPGIDSVCAWAISEMGQLATESLIDALGNEDWRVKMYAIEILGNLGDCDAVEPLIDVLKDENWLIQEYAISVLNKISDQDSSKWQRGKPEIGPLIATINDKDEDLKIRSQAVRALGKIKDDNSVETLIDLLDDHDISFTLRKDIVAALGETKDSRAVNCLQAALSDFFVRDEAVIALNKISGVGFSICTNSLR